MLKRLQSFWSVEECSDRYNQSMMGNGIRVIFNFHENNRIWKPLPDLFTRFEEQSDERRVVLDEFQH